MTWLHRLLVRWFDRHDPALYQTGVRQVFSGYDYEAAKQASRRAKSRSDTGRQFTGKPKAKKNVVPIRKKAAS